MNQVKAFGPVEVWELDMRNERRNIPRRRRLKEANGIESPQMNKDKSCCETANSLQQDVHVRKLHLLIVLRPLLIDLS